MHHKLSGHFLFSIPHSFFLELVDDLRYRTHQVLCSKMFDVCLGCIVIANVLVMGIQSQAELNEEPMGFFQVADSLFLSLYIVELLMRFFAHKWLCLKNRWVQFDVLLVIEGMLSVWIIEPVVLALSGDAALDSPQRLLRVLRVVRLGRALRVFIQFRQLWKLVGGLLASGETIFYTFLLLVALLFVFAVPVSARVPVLVLALAASCVIFPTHTSSESLLRST